MLSREGGIGTIFEGRIEHGYLEIGWGQSHYRVYLFLTLNKYADQVSTINKM